MSHSVNSLKFGIFLTFILRQIRLRENFVLICALQCNKNHSKIAPTTIFGLCLSTLNFGFISQFQCFLIRYKGLTFNNVFYEKMRMSNFFHLTNREAMFHVLGPRYSSFREGHHPHPSHPQIPLLSEKRVTRLNGIFLKYLFTMV